MHVGHQVEGRIRIEMTPAKQGYGVSIDSTRPTGISRLFHGRSVNDTLNTIPLLFSICGQAQGVAAVRAMESALVSPAAPVVEYAREHLLRLETLREHLFRILLDWPRFYGEEPDNQLLTQLVAGLHSLKTAIDPQQQLLRQPGLGALTVAPLRAAAGALQPIRQCLHLQLFGMEPGRWLELDADRLLHWIHHLDTPLTRLLRHVLQEGWSQLGACETASLPPLDIDALLARLDSDMADDFIAHPSWDECRYETGAFSRRREHPMLQDMQQRYGPGLLVRLLARLVEIATLFVELQHSLDRHQPLYDRGVSQLETARGRLCHRVELEGDRIVRYQILAPTEWNFSPLGVAAQLLTKLPRAPEDQIRQQAGLLIQAIDPCVGFSLQLTAEEAPQVQERRGHA